MDLEYLKNGAYRLKLATIEELDSGRLVVESCKSEQGQGQTRFELKAGISKLAVFGLEERSQLASNFR